MSESFGTRHATIPGGAGEPVSGPIVPGQAVPGQAADDQAARGATVHEAYSFACMNCGHGWEQSYDIAHHTDEHGHTSCVYYAGSQRVPSPLTQPACANCGGHLVRIMRSGRVSDARWEGMSHATPWPPRQPSAGEPHRPGPLAAGLTAEPPGREGEPPSAKPSDRSDAPPRGIPWLATLLAFLGVTRTDPDYPGGGSAHGGDDRPRRAA